MVMAKARLKTIAVSTVIVVFVLLGVIWVLTSIGTDLRTGSGTFSSVPASK
jgi:hypothetical protein